MAKTHSVTDILAGLTPQAPSNKTMTLDVPDFVAEQVQVMSDTGKVLSDVPVTDDAGYAELRSLYLAAAKQIGGSATVRKNYAGDGEDRKWVSSYISVGRKRGKRANHDALTNGADPATDSEAPVSEAASRGW